MKATGLARAGILTFAFVVTGAVLAFAATLAVSNVAGPAVAGQFFQVIALFSIATTLATFGADTGLVRALPALNAREELHRTAPLLRTAVRPVLALSGVVAAGGVIAVSLPGTVNVPAEVRNAVLLAAPLVVLGTGMNLAFGTLRGLHRVPTFSFLQNVLLPSMRLIGVLLVVIVGGSLFSLVAAWTAPVLIVLVLAVVLVRRVLPAPAPSLPTGAGNIPLASPRQFWSFASARGVAAMIEALLEWVDVLLVALILGPAPAGVYGVVNRCIRMGAMLDHTARMVTGPSISAALATGDLGSARSVFTRTTVVLIATAVPFYLTLIMFGPSVLSLFGDAFTDGGPALSVISAAMLLAVTAGGVQSLLLMAGRSRWQLMNKCAALVVAVVLNLVLIPHWGLLGAATAWAASVLTDTGLALFQSVRILGIAPRWRTIGGTVLLVALLAGGEGMLVRHLVSSGPTGLLVHGAVLVLVSAGAVPVLARRTRPRRRARASVLVPPEEATPGKASPIPNHDLQR